MKVSIIVPVYNTKDYLKQCLDSLVAQTLEDLEILVVDDGSTDGSTEIVREFSERYPERLKAYFKDNAGQASARNYALQYAKGEYIGFVDSDDWVDSSMYEVMLAFAQKEMLDIVVCNLDDHFSNGKVIAYDTNHAKNKFMQTPSACNKLFSKNLIGNQTFMDGIWYEDFNFTTKLLMKTECIGYCAEFFYHCHSRTVSTMNNHNSPKNLDIIVAVDDILDFARRNFLYDKYEKDIEYIVLEHVLITTINRVARQKHPEKNRVIAELRHYVKNKYPKFQRDEAFLNMPRNRRIVAKMNAMGLHSLSRILLLLSAKIKH
ncbi:MAG: glycosyl transferase family 2 [Bacillota bacterium]|nr:MAG: glycosyl transferase family 2 [Bacillota bacterium]